MYEQRAICPACERPLDGDLAASSCNHVFHRTCLAGLKECPKCKEQLEQDGCLNLFGVSFGKGKELTAAMMVTRLQATGHVVDLERVNGEGMKAATQILALREDVEDRRAAIQEAELRRDKAQEAVKTQKEKLESAEKKEAKKCDEHRNVAAKLDIAKDQHRALCLQAEQNRQRGAALDYWNELCSSKPEEEALAYLTKFVGMVGEPEKILAEVGKLRDHYRSKLAVWQKEGAKSAQSLSVARSAISESQRRVDDLRREIEMLRGGEPELHATAGSGSLGKARRGIKRLRSHETEPLDEDFDASFGPPAVRAPASVSFLSNRRL